MKVRFSEYGGSGVAIALHHHRSTDQVFWSPARQHPDGSPAGGFNSFVVVAKANGPWKSMDGTRCDLVSVNGRGEIRWQAEPNSRHYAEGADQYFSLESAEALTRPYWKLSCRNCSACVSDNLLPTRCPVCKSENIATLQVSP